MKSIEIFDPAMCCSTGVCGPSVDKNLLRMATLLDALKNMGIEVKRYNLSSEPQAFTRNKTISQLLRDKGTDILPVTLLDGKVVVTGHYPTTAQMSEWTEKDLSYLPVLPSSQKDEGGCCCGNDLQKDEGGCCCGNDLQKDEGGCCC